MLSTGDTFKLIKSCGIYIAGGIEFRWHRYI